MAAHENLVLVNASNNLTRELRKRFVSRAHNHNTIATAGQSDKGVTAGVAIRKYKSLSTMPFDFRGNVATSNTTIDSAAKIYRLGHNQNVSSRSPLTKQSTRASFIKRIGP